MPPLRTIACQGAVTAVHAYRLDVRVERFADPQPVEGEERDQRVITRRTKAGLDEEAAELVAVQPEGAGLDIDLGASDVRCWVAFEDPFDMAVPVEAPERRKSSGDGGMHGAVGFHGATEDLESLLVHHSANSRRSVL